MICYKLADVESMQCNLLHCYVRLQILLVCALFELTEPKPIPTTNLEADPQVETLVPDTSVAASSQMEKSPS